MRARSLSCDLHFETRRFLKLLPEFTDHGMALVQSTKEMPDTLELSRMGEGLNFYRVLKQNGMFLYFHLPHAVEYASLACFDRAYLEGVLRKIPPD